MFYCCYHLPSVLLKASAGLGTAQKRMEPVPPYKGCMRTASSEAGTRRPQRETAARRQGAPLNPATQPSPGRHQVSGTYSGEGEGWPLPFPRGPVREHPAPRASRGRLS